MNLLALAYEEVEVGVRVGVEVGGIGVGLARARVDDINPTSATTNKSMNKPR
jgi:hypothetical protein